MLRIKAGVMKEEEGASALGFLALLLLVGLALVFVFFVIFGYTIPPGYIGVRQIKWGPYQGFSVKGMEPGVHWGVPGYSLVHFVPQTLQRVSFEREFEGKRSPYSYPALEIQTADRATVDVDVSILARFYPAPGKDPETKLDHAGPSQLLQSIGPRSENWVNHVKKTAEDQLKRKLGNISTGEFYDPKLREEEVEQAQEEMNQVLAAAGIKIEAVLLRRYTYRDDRIDQAIFQKNLQDQEQRLNESAGKLAEARAALEQVSAEWDAKIRTLQVDGENRARVLRSEGDLLDNQKRADGDLEVATARAKVDHMRADALSKSAGANAFLARELSALLGSIRGGVVSEVDPYDIQAWLKKFGVEGGEQQQ